MANDDHEFAALTDSHSLTLLDRFLRPALLILAWLVFELTANATLSLVLACLNFGMNDFRTSRWLWQVDPRRQRALACAAFYFASGIWKTAVVPLFTAGTIAIAWALYSRHAMRPNHPITIQLKLALTVGLWAALILVIVVLVAVGLSLAARWRVWVHPNLHRSRREDHWPPYFLPAEKRLQNMASAVLLTAIFAIVLIGPVATLSILGRVDLPRAVRGGLNVLVVFGYPIFGVLGLGLLRGRIFARTPWECWPESIRQLETADGMNEAIDSLE